MSETMSEYSSVSGWGSLEKNNIFLLLQIVPSNDLMVLVHHMCDVTQRIQQETCWVEIWHQNFLSRIELTNTTVDSEMPQGPKLIKNSMYIYISLSLFLSLHGWLYIWLVSPPKICRSYPMSKGLLFLVRLVRFIWSKHLLRGRRETTEESPIWCGHSVFTQEPAQAAARDVREAVEICLKSQNVERPNRT